MFHFIVSFIQAYECYDRRVASEKERQKNLAEQLRMLLEELEKYAARVFQNIIYYELLFCIYYILLFDLEELVDLYFW